MEAERLLAEGLRIAGLKESDLPELPGGDLRKITIASRIARASIVNMEWINQRLQMKSAANVRQHLWRLKGKEEDLRKLPKTLQKWMR